jgi:hypothetical protein
MVTFVCEFCQASMSKPKVDAHARKCRGCWVLSCVDCGVRFEGEQYAGHTQCVSEAQKYGMGASHAPKSVQNGKQSRWADAVNAVLCATCASVAAATTTATATAAQRATLERLVNLVGAEKIPQKRVKFINFSTSAIPRLDQGTAGGVFDLCKAEFDSRQPCVAAGQAAAVPPPQEPASPSAMQHPSAKRLCRSLKKFLSSADAPEGVPLKQLTQLLQVAKPELKRAIRTRPDSFALYRDGDNKRVVKLVA